MSYGYGHGPATGYPQHGQGGYGYGGYGHGGYGYGYGQVVRLSAPASVHVVAILQYLGGVVGLVVAALVALVMARGGGQAGGTTPTEVHDAIAGGSLVTPVVVAVFALFAILIGRKLQRGRQWARVLVLLLCTLSLLGTLYTAVVLDLRPSSLVSAACPALYVVLLNTSAARSWFRHGTY